MAGLIPLRVDEADEAGTGDAGDRSAVVHDLYLRLRHVAIPTARRIMQRCTEEMPLYRLLPQEELDGEMLDITAYNVRLFLETLREQRMPNDDELAPIVASAARRANERIPLANVLMAYHIGARVGWETLVDRARHDESEALVAAAAHILEYMQVTSASIATAFLQEHEAIHGDERNARSACIAALLADEPVGDLAQRAGVELADAYLVVALHVGSGSSEPDPHPGVAVARRRRVRGIQAALDQLAGMPVLADLDADGGFGLVPVGADGFAAVEGRLEGLVRPVEEADGSQVTLAAVRSPRIADLAARLVDARSLVDLVRRLGRPPGIYRMDDLLFELQLTRPGAARAALAAKLGPVAEHATLLETLELHRELDRNRRAVAVRLGIHPNTVDYRLKRIAELTGLDPATTRDWQILTAALLAHRYESGA